MILKHGDGEYGINLIISRASGVTTHLEIALNFRLVEVG